MAALTTTLHFDEQWEAVRGAFVIHEGGQVDNFRILLLDDVMTSGATLDACSRALSDVGAKWIVGLSIARTVRRRVSPTKECLPGRAR